MQQLTIEAISLVGHRLLRNPASHKDLATGQMNQDQAAQHKLDASFYKNLLVCLMSLTFRTSEKLSDQYWRPFDHTMPSPPRASAAVAFVQLMSCSSPA